MITLSYVHLIIYAVILTAVFFYIGVLAGVRLFKNFHHIKTGEPDKPPYHPFRTTRE